MPTTSVRLAVQLQRRADDAGGAAKAAQPQAVADDHDAIATCCLLFALEDPAAIGRHTQRREEVGRDQHAAQPLGLAVASQVGVPRHRCRDRYEGARTAAVIDE